MSVINRFIMLSFVCSDQFCWNVGGMRELTLHTTGGGSLDSKRPRLRPPEANHTW